ncbi:putative membrane protein [Escherichia coli DEC4D]|nr:putative membrane protein [Escherichia coli DEC4D]
MTVKLRLTVAALLLFLVVMVDFTSRIMYGAGGMGCWSAALWYCCGR